MADRRTADYAPIIFQKCVTMKEITTIFSNDDFGEVRVIGTTESPLFCAADVCRALGYSNSRDAIARHADEGDVVKRDTPTSSGVQSITYVNESGLYALIFGSKIPSAKKFKKWVTSEVLPSIRKTGGYIAAGVEDTDEEIMARALLVADATIKRKDERIAQLQAENESAQKQIEEQQSKIEQDAPKVLFADAVSTSQRSCLVAELAKILKQNGVDIGQNRLYGWLRSNGYLGARGLYYNQPTQKAMKLGLFEIKQTTITKPDGTVLVATTPKITGKGQIYFVDKFLSRKGGAPCLQ